MLALDIATSLGSTPRILCLGAHPDDIEIGCGGTILELAEALPAAEWHLTVLKVNPERHAEANAAVAALLGDRARKRVRLQSFRDGFLPYHGAEVKDFFETVKREVSPDLIFTHASHDRHQDHRLVSELTWNTWRNHLILEYEIPKYDGDLGQPQAYSPVRAAVAERKIRTILDVFASQRSREWFDREVLLSLMRLRGVECNARERYAEAFYARKWSLGFGAGK